MKIAVTILCGIVITSSALRLPSLEAKTTHASIANQRGQSRCICIACRLNLPASSHQSKRSPKGDISIEPGAFHSGNTLNATQIPGQESSQRWTPTFEGILTAIFRAVITILSLLNVNFTWRVHGRSSRLTIFRVYVNKCDRYPCQKSMAFGKRA